MDALTVERKIMIISKNKIIQNDIEYLINNSPIEWRDLKNKSVLITGATGLLGSHLVRTFVLANETYELNMTILALVRDKKKSAQVFSEIEHYDGLKFIVQDIVNEIGISDKVNYIFHCASITDSWSFVHSPVETMETTILGCKNILEFAKKCHVDSVVYLSTMEIYGQSKKEYISEDDYGYLDPLAVRSSYPESKKTCECMCVAYEKEYAVPVKIVRLTQTYGPGVTWEDKRVFAQFAKDIVGKKDIVLHTSGRTIRNYCYTRDAIAAMLIVLMRGGNGEAYNIANDKTEISILDMAKMLIKKYSDGSNTVLFENLNSVNYGYNPENRTCICSDKIRSLGWEPEVGLEEMFDNLIGSMYYEMTKCVDINERDKNF